MKFISLLIRNLGRRLEATGLHATHRTHEATGRKGGLLGNLDYIIEDIYTIRGTVLNRFTEGGKQVLDLDEKRKKSFRRQVWTKSYAHLTIK
jgi:hypothetical protein